jgi:hypothetical protein
MIRVVKGTTLKKVRRKVMKAKSVVRHAIALIAVMVGFLLFADCGKKSTEPKESLCGLLSIQDNQPNIAVNCQGGFSSRISNIEYDVYGRVIAYDFDYSCTNPSTRYTGKIYNIRRDDIGRALSFSAVINGESCSVSASPNQ